MTMKLSERTLTWIMRLYPPFLLQRIWVKKFLRGFTGVDVRIHHSLLNRNSNGSIFGGTIFSATDPLYALLFGQLMRRKEMKVIVWLKSARIQYKKPARSSLLVQVRIDPDDVAEAESSLNTLGTFVKTFTIELIDREGEICAIAENEVYIKKMS